MKHSTKKTANTAKPRKAGKLCGLALAAALSYFPAVQRAEAGMTDMTRIEICDDSPVIELYQIFSRHDAASVIGDDMYDVSSADADAPGNPGWRVYSQNPSHSAVELAVDSRSSDDYSTYTLVFEPQGSFSTSSGRLRFSRVTGSQDYTYDSPVTGSGSVDELIQNHSGYTPYFSYDSSMGPFSMNFTPVPEPGTLGMLAAGFGALGLGRFMRKRK